MTTMDEKVDLFVEKLLTDGARVPCDATVDSFKENEELPSFYDEDLFKKGQEFYHRNNFGLFSGKIFGLISVISIPTILKILVHTKKSGNELTAYRRYLATIFHMIIWYESDFKPGSKLWKSIAEVKNLHNSASNGGCKAGLNRISQKDMALTQFGFMGFQLIRSKLLGVHYATPEEWKAFIHLWRVVGHVLGIEDRFNICRGSVAETKVICEKLVKRAFILQIKEKDPKFIEMSEYLINGLWALNPLLNFNVIMCALSIMLTNNENLNKNEKYKDLTFWEKCRLQFIGLVLISLQWAPFRWYFNHTNYRDLWLIKNFPFLAYYKFGYKKAHVKILAKVD